LLHVLLELKIILSHIRLVICYDVSVNGIVHGAFNRHSVKSLCERHTPPFYHSNAVATLELLMIRRGFLYVPNMSADDINALLSAVCRPTNCQYYVHVVYSIW